VITLDGGSLTITRLVLLVVGGLALVTEIAGLVWPRLLPLISPTMRVDGLRWIVWPALWGTLGGHWWSPPWLRFAWAVRVGPYVMVAFGLGVILFDLLGPRVPVEAAFAILCGSLLVGAIFWSMAR
jgi:hypothetical protein